MPPTSPRISGKRLIWCAVTNSRTFFWLVAVLGDSAGTRWSKMIATRSGSHTRGTSPVPAYTSRNWLITSAAFSCDIARSTRGSTTSPPPLCPERRPLVPRDTERSQHILGVGPETGRRPADGPRRLGELRGQLEQL